MNRNFVILFSLFISINSLIFSQSTGWGILPVASPMEIHGIHFVNPSIGYLAVYMGGVYKTTDGGNTWRLCQTAGRGDWDIHFINENLGWACGPLCPQGYAICRTTDNGATWSDLTVNLNANLGLTSICFTDSLRGWAVGGWRAPTWQSQLILKTTNCGNSWITTQGPDSAYLWKVHFVDSLYGWACGYGKNGGEIISTTNGGDTWNIQLRAQSGCGYPMLHSIFFVNRIIGFAVGNVGTILKTTNGGLTWIFQNSNIAHKIVDVFFINENKGWAVGGPGLILHTSNGGNTWIAQNVPTNEYLTCLNFVNDSLGYIGGTSGIVLKTTSAGFPTGINEAEIHLPTSFSLSQNFPNPFNPITIINYRIPINSNVTFNVFDVLGNVVATLLNEEKAPGNYELKWDASGLTSGVYFYRLQAGSFIETKKMILIR